MKLRLGALPYLNVRPLRAALAASLPGFDAAVTTAPPAELARGLAAGELDIAPVSAGSLPALPGMLALPAACVASDGPVRSVLLFSDRPLPKLGRTRILHGTDSVASVKLLEVLARQMHGLELALAPDLLGEHLAEGFRAPVLLIGDACLRYALRAPHPVRVDLGELWREHTGLPMVFALYAVRARFADEHPELVASFAGALARAAADARERCVALVSAAAAETGLPVATVADYFTRLRWTFDDRAAAGLTRYLELLERSGRAPAGFRIRYFGKEAR